MVNQLSLLFLFVTSSMMFQADALTTEEQHILDLHNKYRQAEDVGLPDLAWDADLATTAHIAAAQSCSLGYLEHSSRAERMYKGDYTGENIGYSSGSTMPAIDAVMGLFIGEKTKYHYDVNTHTCRGGKSKCLHYTQIVWKNTNKVGCSVVHCQTDTFTYLSCNYYPGGNLKDENPY